MPARDPHGSLGTRVHRGAVRRLVKVRGGGPRVAPPSVVVCVVGEVSGSTYVGPRHSRRGVRMRSLVLLWF